MKKEILFTVLFFLIISISSIILADYITGGLTEENVAVSISVVSAPPALELIKPVNETYLIGNNLKLEYSEGGADTVWYKIDSGSNVTISGNTTFNTTEGQHTLYLYANSSGGTRARNVTFTVNSTIFIISYSEYNGSKRGSSTEFRNYTYEDLQDMSVIILENTDSGKILFNEAINLTDDEDFSDNALDLDTHANISFNRIELNSTALPNFNKSATLWLHNLTFSYPRILRDGSVCSSTICIQENYSGGTLKFNVTGFTVYSAEETPAEVVPPSGGGGGGGGISTLKDFSVNKETISITLKQGGTEKDFFIIKNTGNKALEFTIKTQNIEEFLKISEPIFILNAGESKTIILDFLVRAEVIPTLYLGKILVGGIASTVIQKEILVSVEVESRSPLFDVKVEIPKRFLYLMPGEELVSNIKIFNLERERTTDVFVEYIIKDEEENEILYETETVFLETQTSLTKSFEIPKEIKSGMYILYVRTTYDGKVASSTAWFNIGKTSVTSFILRNINLIGTILVIILLLISLIIILRKLEKGEIKLPKLIKKKESGYGIIKEKLLKLRKPSKKKEWGLKDYKRKFKGRIEKI